MTWETGLRACLWRITLILLVGEESPAVHVAIPSEGRCLELSEKKESS